MKWRGALVAGALTVLSGCVYYNAIYNAERLFRAGEDHRRAARDSAAATSFSEVLEKSARGFRKDPTGEWADDALILMGKAYVRLGELREARAALEEAVRRARDEETRLRALLHLGVVHVMTGDDHRGASLLDQALEGLPSPAHRAEGHLWRGRVSLAAGEAGPGWWDLEQAGRHPATRMDAALTRADWGVRLGDQDRMGEGIGRLLAYREAGLRVDTVAGLVSAAAERWGPAVAVGFLSGADTARWEPTPRGMLLLTRAGLLREAGDTARAGADMRRVARGLGPAAEAARLELARWHLSRARDLVEARSALAILLPAVSAAEAAGMARDLQEMLKLAHQGMDDPLAWFLAGEICRDGLAAPELARGFFLAFTDADPDGPWAAKALLAALAMARDEGERGWLLERLEAEALSPYVLAARGEPALGLEALEEELARRLQEVRSR